MRASGLIFLMSFLRRQPPKSLTMTKATKRSGVYGQGGGLAARGGTGSGAPRKGDARLLEAAEETGLVRKADGLRGLGRNGPPLPVNQGENVPGRLRPCTDGASPCERSTDVDAGDKGSCEQALSHEYKHFPYIVDAEGTGAVFGWQHGFLMEATAGTKRRDDGQCLRQRAGAEAQDRTLAARKGLRGGASKC